MSMCIIPPLTMLLGRVNVWGANVGISSATEHYRPTVHYGWAWGEGICAVRGEGEAGGTVDVTGGEEGGSLLLLCVTETVQLPIVTPPFLWTMEWCRCILQYIIEDKLLHNFSKKFHSLKLSCLLNITIGFGYFWSLCYFCTHNSWT